MSNPPGPRSPEPSEVLAELERVVTSEVFVSARRSSRLLSHIVHRALENRPQDLKEYQLGLDVFGRAAGFDPSQDSTVRVEASRLRHKLREYYATLGAGDSVRIELPKGAYLPLFRSNGDCLEPQPVRPTKRRLLIATAVGALFIAAGIMASISNPMVRAGPHSIAVLPFLDLSAARDQEAFADGIAEDLISRLAGSPELRVIARSSTARFKAKDIDLDEIRRRLRADWIVEGSVIREGARLRISARLARTDSGQTAWVEIYEQSIQDTFRIQEDIARKVATRLNVKLTALKSNPHRDPTSSLDAYGYYLIGRHHWERRGETDLRRSIEMYERALSLDPNFALAFAGLADTYTVMATNKVAPALEMAAKARDAAHKAIALDSHIAEPHAALGTILPCFDWDWESAEKEFRRALELNPGYATGRQWYGLHLLTRGRFHDAERQLRLARDLNPLAWMIAVNVGDVLYYSGQYDRAVAEYRKVIETDGGYLVPDLMTAAALFRLGRFNEVIPHADIFLSKNPWHPYAAGYKILALRKTGDIRQYELLRAGFEQARTEKYYAPDLRAWIYAMFGENEQALAELQKAYEAHEAPSTKIKIDPAFDALRSDPRFQALLKAARLDR